MHIRIQPFGNVDFYMYVAVDGLGRVRDGELAGLRDAHDLPACWDESVAPPIMTVDAPDNLTRGDRRHHEIRQ